MDLARNLIGRINAGDTLTRTAAARPGQIDDAELIAAVKTRLDRYQTGG